MNTLLQRRQFLKQLLAGAGGLAACGLMSPLQQALAADGHGKRLLIVNFNGGYDNLALVQPDLGSLSARRPTIFKDGSALLAGPVNEGFHPHLTAFKSLWDSGDLAVCHRVGYLNSTRSHEDSRSAFARGVADRRSNTTSGFLNRLGATNFSNNFSLVDFTGGNEAVERGAFRATIVRRLQDFGFDNNGSSDRFVREIAFTIMDTFEKKNTQAQAVGAAWELAANAEETIRTAITNNTVSVPYPNNYVGRQFQDVDIAFSQLGTVVAYTEIGGFDTHSEQNDTMDRILPEFNLALQRFIQNMTAKGLWNNTVVLVLSEFSRTIDENGNGGTDHGNATDLYLMGPSVRGGVYGGAYTNGDFVGTEYLEPTLNVLDVYRPIVQALGYNPSQIFEAYPDPVSLSLFT